MTHEATPASDRPAPPAAFVSGLLTQEVLPNEDANLFDALRHALLADLAPETAYERVLAENLVSLEWEALRHRRLRDAGLKTAARDLATGVFATGELTSRYRATEETLQLGRDFVSDDRERRARALEALAEHEIAPHEIMARAYGWSSDTIELHEKALARIETRRRHLREDYERLRAARARSAAAEDAEIVA